MSNFRLLFRAVKCKISEIKEDGLKESFDLSKEKSKYLFRQLIHPIDSFNDLKFENKASVQLSLIVVAVFFLIRLLDQTLTAYLFQSSEPSSVNLFERILTSIGLVLIWTVCNWATCTLANGEGSFKIIWIITAYSLIPYCICTFISIGISYFLTQNELVFYTTIRGFGLIWTLILLFLGMLVAHQYTVLKTVISVILTLLMILLCCFLAVVIFSITQQIQDFVLDVFKELVTQK